MPKTNNKRFNTVIVEDNPTDLNTIQKELRREFSDLIDYQNIKIFTTKEEAQEEILKLTLDDWPDLVLLDIQLHGDNIGGFKVMDFILKKIGEIPFAVIILTSYHEPAIEWGKRTRAFPQFIAYVVKGIYQGKGLVQQLKEALNILREEIITIPTRGMGDKSPGIRYVSAHNIYFVKADNNYSIVHLSEEEIGSTKKLGDFIEELPIESFMRVHRGYHVNRIYVKEVQPNGIIPSSDGAIPETRPKGGVLVMKNGELIPIPNSEKRKEVEDWIKRMK